MLFVELAKEHDAHDAGTAEVPIWRWLAWQDRERMKL